jgi:type VI secretion system secreted protein Hcp
MRARRKKPRSFERGGLEMAADMFLKVEGIKGESVDSKHKDEIEVLSWSWGVTQAVVQHGATFGAGVADCSELTIMKKLDISSPLLVKHCAQGAIIKSMLLTLRKAGKEQLEYCKVAMTECLVTSVQISGGGGEVPSESASFRFTKIKIEYLPQKPDGSLGGVVPYEWDIKAKKA